MLRAIRARYIFTAAGPPLRDAALTIRDGQIVAVGSPEGTVEDRGDVAILPALLNAHTHLEFSDLDQPLGQPGLSFVDWIRQVIAWRRERAEQDAEADQQRMRAIVRGLDQCRACGVTAVGEIAAPPFLAAPFESHAVEAVVFLELLGLSEERLEPLIELARQHLAARQQGFVRGISPHAPYTVGPRLLERVAQLSRERQAPVAMHLAESADELELLASHSGPFVELLASVDAWHPAALPRGLRPLDYLRLLAECHRALVIHGNYLARDEIGFLGERAESMSVVYCPRTHAYFGHGRYPLAEMLAAGVNVALGTDSRASNPDLNLLEEMRWVARHHAGVPPQELLRMGTLNAARALGCDRWLGSLEPGKRADHVLLPLDAAESEDPYELVFDSSAQIVG